MAENEVKQTLMQNKETLQDKENEGRYDNINMEHTEELVKSEHYNEQIGRASCRERV